MRFSLILTFSVTPFTVWATDFVQPGECEAPRPPELTSPTTLEENENDRAVRVNANRSEAVAGDSAKFEGQVQLTQGVRRITAEQAKVSEAEGKLTATGGIFYQDLGVSVAADSLSADMNASEAELSKAKYWLNGQQVHGDAKLLQITADDNIELTDATFTTCVADDPTWELEADSIILDSETEWGEIWHAKVNMFGVPVMYMPYMTVPITDKRKSGFLFPSIATSSDNGFDVSVPYYWNIAPNMDATLTTQVMSARGTFVRGVGRYLQPWGQGQVNLEYIGKDREDDNQDRYLFHFEHAGKLDKNWRIFGEFTQFSDDNYFSDMDSDVSTNTDNQINREGEVSYFSDNWDMAIRVQDIEVLGDVEKPFQVMPSLTFNYYQHGIPANLNFDFNSELTHFAHRDSNHLTATRLHLEPTLSLPYQSPLGSLNAELKLMQTFYDQSGLNYQQNDDLDDQVSRTLPQLRIGGQMNFERDFQFKGNDYLQTVEPQFQYLYIPHEDQSDIGLYDTAQLQEDYYGLFRDRRYSGLDRIADANQLTVGLSTRVLDDGLHERGSFSIGQIFYFEDSEVSLGSEDEQRQESTSALAMEGQWQIDQRWALQGSFQFDTQSGDTNKTELSVDYQVDNDRMIQLSHRYVPDLGVDDNGDSVDISQAGLRTTWPVAKDIYFIGNYYYDTHLSRAVESYAGFQYESCCWAIQFSYYKELETNYEGEDFNTIGRTSDYDKGFRINFVLKGLGSSGPIGVSKMRDEGQFNYRKPYYLRN
ncbi:LPS assembly protein LptD [Ferrimonas lipolytica]|uniref:LPS-assembly protein LptD n=1 Tax=Ferrimonas lipolytica TaxID=2724191 RepID=A0A6H1UJ45_9GAMM|nr:LPS assembly protein LptD [Ferrimonas lipolytica]QIZ77822.1 LPS assembly protein LptD [Ferrimonas lipolytica]